MCGRYYVDDNTAKEIERLVRRTENSLREKAVLESQREENRPEKGALEKSLPGESLPEKSAGRDIHPSDLGPVLLGGKDMLRVEEQRWGFPSPRGRGVVFNARSETALEKRMFRESVLRRRCVIPAACFYEWDRSKNKTAFWDREAPVLFMAGCYREYPDACRFVILTTKAGASVEKVHDRMPLILAWDEIGLWTGGGDDSLRLLEKKPPELLKKMEYEQQKLKL